MKLFDWNDEKNQWLRQVRGIAFEDVIYCITHKGLLDVLEHPNQDQYPDQRVFIVDVDVDGYAFLVPFIEDEHVVSPKTIVPSREMTRKYLGGGEE